jgi:hypothetical protein
MRDFIETALIACAAILVYYLFTQQKNQPRAIMVSDLASDGSQTRFDNFAAWIGSKQSQQ